MTALTKAEILAKCTPALIASRNESAIAAVVNAGRVAPNKVEIGKGTVISTMGLVDGNMFLDIIDSVADYRHIKGNVADGRFEVGSPLAQAALQGFAAAGKITQAHADALCAVGVSPDPVTSFQVAQILEGM